MQDSKKTGKGKTRSSLFSTPDKQELKRKCDELIRDGRFGRNRVLAALEDSNILEKYNLTQIRTRLTYERDLQKKGVKY